MALSFTFAMVPFGHSAPPLNNLMFSLSPDNGGAQTQISWTFAGPIKDDFAIGAGTWGAVGSLFDGAFNSSYFNNSSSEFFPVINAGTITDRTENSIWQITEIGIGAYDSSRYIALFFGGASLAVDGHQVQYMAGIDSYVINVPFSAFNPGTYTSTDDRLQGSGMSYTTTVVPEPSAFSLLVVGLGGLSALRRRKSD